MVNQQMLDYIKRQLQQGVSKEIIRKDLLRNDWTSQDVEEGFSALSISTQTNQPLPSPPLSGTSKKVWVILSISLISILVIGMGGIYFVTQRSSTTDGEFAVLGDASSKANLSDGNINITENALLSDTGSEILDCKEDFDCFIEATGKGARAKISMTYLGVFGVPITSLEEIWDVDRFGDYTYFHRIGSAGNKVAQSIIDEALSSGVSQEEIPSLEKMAVESAKASVGTETLCKYTDTKSMVDALLKWGLNEFSTNDLAFAKCKVKLPEEKGTLLDNSDCLLTYPLQEISLDLPGGGVTAFGADISGFRKSGSDVSWVVEDENIATVSPSIGLGSKVEAVSIGNTRLIITDNAVGPDCKDVVPITVTK